MAADAVGLLDALEVNRVDVFGVSMGGMIAQEMALLYPERVRTVVLGCTTAGGSAAAGIDRLRRDIEQFQTRTSDELPGLDWFSEFMKKLWTDQALAESRNHVQDFVLSMIRFPPTPIGLHEQASAIARHDTYGRLPGMRHSTLVLAGTDDPLIDPLNSMILADRIPHAELRSFAGLKHAFHLEEPDLVNDIIIEFLQRHRP
jgi:pimeloyl-ACP methyl ester carboxylesterase